MFRLRLDYVPDLGGGLHIDFSRTGIIYVVSRRRILSVARQYSSIVRGAIHRPVWEFFESKAPKPLKRMVCRGDLREGTAPNTFSGGVRGGTPPERYAYPKYSILGRWARRAAATYSYLVFVWTKTKTYQKHTMGERHQQHQQHQQHLHNDSSARDIDLDDSMEDEDDDDDTVVGTCLHCSAPPPPRSSSRVSGSSSNPCGTGSGGGGGGKPCSSASTAAMTSFAASCPPPATRVQVSCDDCRSFICDGASKYYVTVV